MMRFLLTVALGLLVSASPTLAFEISISGDGDEADLSSVTILDRDTGSESSVPEQDGKYIFSPSEEWMDNRGIVPADIVPERESQDLKIEALLRTCRTSNKCENIDIVVPIIPLTFPYQDVEKKCSDRTPSNTFKTRLKKYYYCRAAYKWMKTTNLADAQNWPASSFALWGWFSSAFQLYTNHRSRSVPYIPWDQQADAAISDMLQSEDLPIFVQTIAVREQDIQQSLDDARRAFMTKLAYAQYLVGSGSNQAAAQIVAGVSDEYAVKRATYAFSQSDVDFMNTLREKLGVGGPLE